MITMLLIKAGAEVNLADMEGKTPLWFAVAEHNMQMVSMLVRSGADVNISPYDDDDKSPMEMAKCEGMLELLRLAPSRIERRCEKTATNLSVGRPAWRVGLSWVEPRFSVGDRGGVLHRRGSRGVGARHGYLALVQISGVAN